MATRREQSGADRTRLEEGSPQDAGIEALLREVGARAEPSEELARAVHTAVHAEWRALVEELRRQRRAQRFSRTSRWAAGAAIVVLASTVGVRLMAPATSTVVATITRIDGHLLATANDESRASRAVAQSVSVGETLQTDDRSRAALAYSGNLSVRLDHNTIVKIAAADRIVLTSGALYVDSPTQDPAAADLMVQAHAGSVRHAGTQYQVRTHADDIEVSVREGRVLIASAGGTSEGQAGEQVRVTTRGEIARTALAANDSQWHWVASTAPAFDINDRPLIEFIEWVARETGRKVVYASQHAQAAARQVVLRGSVAGLDPDTALNAVLATTHLRRYQPDAESIGITLAAPVDSTKVARPTP
jgi:ferric-dicitrate binding protein FerR (iron transport regulator)